MFDCENCENYELNEETGEYECIVELDEDEYGALISGRRKACPFFRIRDEYRIVRKQN